MYCIQESTLLLSLRGSKGIEGLSIGIIIISIYYENIILLGSLEGSALPEAQVVELISTCRNLKYLSLFISQLYNNFFRWAYIRISNDPTDNPNTKITYFYIEYV